MLVLAFEKVSLEEAKKVLDGDDKDAAADKSWSDNRRPQPAVKLLAATARWLLDLPQELRPYALAKLYPRIANDLCRLWRQPALWQQYAADLMIVRRDDRPRQGFPAQVASELAALVAHHTTLYPPLPVRGRPDAFR